MAADGFTVNGPVAEMYRVKRHYESSGSIDLPTCMYKLENIHQQKVQQLAPESADNAKLSSVEELERRQEKIFSQIEKLQHQVQDLMKDQNITLAQLAATAVSRARPNTGRSKVPPAPANVVLHPSKLLESSSKTRTAASATRKGDSINDLVICTSPSRIPLSLLVLQQMLAKQFRVLSTSYVHSSAMSSTPVHLRDLYQNGNSPPSNRNAYQIAVTVVWKEDKYSPVLKVNPSEQTPIIGECNIARYLSRLLSPGAYDSSDPVTSTQIDGLIDLADAQLSNDGAQKANFVKAISTQLGKSQWMLGGENLTLADIVLWSAVHQLKQASRAPDNIKRWLDACNQLPEFALARQFI